MPVYESSHKTHYEFARSHVPTVLFGFHFENRQAAKVPITGSVEEIAEHIATFAMYNDSRYILSRTNDLSVITDYSQFGGPSVTTLSENGDIHFFHSIYHERFDKKRKNKLMREEVERVFDDAKRVAKGLAWPLKPYGGADYRLHRGEIEIYLMGGTKDLPKLQKKWRKPFREFGEIVYSSMFKSDDLDVEVVEENLPARFRTKRSGAYNSGYLKSVVKVRVPDLVIKKLP